jgi:hypothetical protein
MVPVSDVMTSSLRTCVIRRTSLQGGPRLSAESIAARGSLDG